MVLDKSSGFGWKNKQKALLSLVLIQVFEFQDYVIFNPQNPHEFVSNSKTQVVFYLWVSRDMGSCVFGARKEMAGGLRGQVSVHNWGHSPDLSLPCSLSCQIPMWSGQSITLPPLPHWSGPAVAGMLFTSPTSAFPWALCHSAAFGKKQVEGEDVLCSLEELGAFLPQETCFGHHSVGPVSRWWRGPCWHCRAQFLNPYPGCFLCFPQDDFGLEYGTPFLSNQVSTAGRDHSMSPSWLSCWQQHCPSPSP